MSKQTVVNVSDQHLELFQGLPELLTLDEVKKALRLGKSAIYDLAARGKLASTKLGGARRFLRSGVIALVLQGVERN